MECSIIHECHRALVREKLRAIQMGCVTQMNFREVPNSDSFDRETSNDLQAENQVTSAKTASVSASCHLSLAEHLLMLDTTVAGKSYALGYVFFSDNSIDLGVLNRPFLPKVVESIEPTERAIIDVAVAQTSPGSRDITRPQIVKWVDLESWSASAFPAVIHSAHKVSDQRSLSNGKRLLSAE
jgi:hypothetical protein